MCLEPEDHMVWYDRTKALSTERLHNLDLCWRDNFKNSVHQEQHVRRVLRKLDAQNLLARRSRPSTNGRPTHLYGHPE